MLIVTTHASRNVTPKRRSTLDLAMVSSLLAPRLRATAKPTGAHELLSVGSFFKTYPATGGGGGEPAGGTSGAAGTAGGGGAAMYAWAGTHAQ